MVVVEKVHSLFLGPLEDGGAVEPCWRFPIVDLPVGGMDVMQDLVEASFVGCR